MANRPAPRGDIHLGELIQTLGELPWQDEAQARAIAASLGFDFSALPTRPQDRENRIFDPALNPPPSDSAIRSRPVWREPVAPAPPPLPVPPPVGLSDVQLHALDTPVAVAPADDYAWLDEEEALYPADEPSPVAPPSRINLVPDDVARGVLSAALATLRPGDDVDFDRLLEQLSHGRLPLALPRRASPTLIRGCQVLLDYGPTMQPWWDDLTGLETQLRDVLGRHSVSVFSFERDPATARPATRRAKATPWRPVAGQPVVVATDFGIQGRPDRPEPAPEGWGDVIGQCRKAGSPLLIFTPWPSDRWPGDLGSYPYLIHWHPHTSAAMVRRRIGLGHRVRP